ncbi:hypothetical protein GCM10027048_01590 [Hymenobacter coalescens]
MQKRISPTEVEKEYKNFLQTALDGGKELNADLLIDVSSQIFQETTITGVTTADDEDKDMLLFQYGVYNWGDEKGEHFSFEIARQFILDKDDEFYQLHFSLIFDPKDFKECDSYNRWSSEFQSLEDWMKDIKASQGYKLAQTVKPIDYSISLDKI